MILPGSIRWDDDSTLIMVGSPLLAPELLDQMTEVIVQAVALEQSGFDGFPKYTDEPDPDTLGWRLTKPSVRSRS